MSRIMQSAMLNRVKQIANVQIAVKTNTLRRLSSGVSIKSIHNDFRYSGTEKNAGALQDLLRRVMEIDADITNTPVAEFKPNTQQCTAYCIDDALDLKNIDLSNQKEFKVQKKYNNLLHMIDHRHGGDVYFFDNGTVVFWGVHQQRQTDLIQSMQKHHQHITSEQVEYTIDEDEITDIKGDIIILNPYLPSIELSKIAFSYGFGRVAKLNSLEQSLDEYLNSFFDNYTKTSKTDLFKGFMRVHKRLIQSSRDGFLGTPDLHWAKPELEEYVSKVSKRFDVQTRVTVLNKKLGHAKELITVAKDLDMIQ